MFVFSSAGGRKSDMSGKASVAVIIVTVQKAGREDMRFIGYGRSSTFQNPASPPVPSADPEMAPLESAEGVTGDSTWLK